ncbi:MAG: TonB-dependent receptor, partial [Candidatus Solibacter usitatus]|nr:TonB-dependent receptor [Candidatus Solibacter usitatus]
FPQVNPAAPINATNGRLVDYFSSLPGTIRRNLGTLRVDHDFSDNDKLYAVYNAQSNAQRSSAVVSPFVGLGLTLNERTNQTLSLSETHLHGGLINEIRGGFNRQPTFRRSNQTLRDFLASIGFNAADIDAYGSVIGPSALDTYGHLAVNFGTGFRNFTNGGRNTFRPLDQNLMTFGDTLSWIKRRHALKFGADFVRNAAVDGFTSGRGNPRGLINYTGAGPDAFARFLMGLPANSVTFVNRFRPPMDVHNWEMGFLVQDEYKIHPRVTLNLGLRYELITPFIEANDLLINFDPNGTGNGGRKGRFVVPSRVTLDSLDSRIINYGVVTADQAGVGRGLVNVDRNNLAPRLGVAWRITDKMVLRGGYGMFYPTSAAQGIRDPLATNAFHQGLTKRNDPAGPLSPWPGATHGFSPLTGGVLNNISGQPSVNAVPFDLQLPRFEQYNITFERELGWRTAARVSYLGTRMHGLISGRDLNMLAPSDKPWGTTTGDGVTACSPDDGDCDLSAADRARLPFPQLGDYLSTFGNVGRGLSDALQIEGNRRFHGGFMFSASYTLLDQKTSAPDTGNASLGGTVYNQFQPEVDYATDAFVSRHRFIAYGVYQVPAGRGRKYGSRMPALADAVAGGWELSWQMFAKSGYGVTPFWYCDNCGPFYPGNVASGFVDATGGFNGTSYRPVVKGPGQVASGDRIFNPDAFAPPPVGADVFDNPNVAKRNLLHGPSATGVNLGIHKVFRIGERVKADLGADINNVFNHPLKLPNQDGAFGDFGNVGSFTLGVNPKTLQPFVSDITRNPDFGRLITSYAQENVDSRRAVRLKLRLYF